MSIKNKKISAFSLTTRYKRANVLAGGETVSAQEMYPKISLKAARVNANLSQEEAARLIGICKATLQNYEKGETVPDWDVVDAIARVYNFPASLINFARKLA